MILGAIADLAGIVHADCCERRDLHVEPRRRYECVACNRHASSLKCLAALDIDIPAGGTIQGHGVKFYRPGTPRSGQNQRSTPVVMQYNNGKTTVLWPDNIRTHEPVLPLPRSSPYAVI